MEDYHVDRLGVEAQQCVKLTSTNSSIGLIVTVMKVEIGISYYCHESELYLDHFLSFVRLDGLVIIVQMSHPIPFRTRT